jgi:sugar phosphate isomerase/epimerase
MSRFDWKLALSVGIDAMNDRSLCALSDAGIHDIELCFPRATYCIPYSRQAKELHALAKSHGVSVSSIHLPFCDGNPASRNEGLREAVITMQRTLMELAAENGTSIAILHPSAEPYGEEERPHRIELAIDMVARLTDAANACGVTLALENLPRTCLCRSSDEMRAFLDAIPDLRVCFDTNHALIEDNLHYLRAVADRLVTLHVSDYDRIDEKHWLPTEGVNDWGQILRTLEEIGYTGRFLYETVEKTPSVIRQNYDRLLAL